MLKFPHRRKFLRLAAGAAALPTVSHVAWAQSYPTRPVRIVVGLAAGSSSDILARLIGQRLSERLGQLGLYPGIGKGSTDFLIEPLDDFSRRVAGRSESTHQSRLIARQKIANGRQIRERFVPHRRGHRQSAEPAGFNVFNRRGCGGEYRLHLPAEQVGQRGPEAPIRHVDQINSRHDLK